MLQVFVHLAFAPNCKRPPVRSWIHYLNCNKQWLLLYDLISGFFPLCKIIVPCYSYGLLSFSSRKATSFRRSWSSLPGTFEEAGMKFCLNIFKFTWWQCRSLPPAAPRVRRQSVHPPYTTGPALQSCSCRALLARPAAVIESGIYQWKYISCSSSEMEYHGKYLIYSTRKYSVQLLCVM